MILLLDLGNTNLDVGVYQHDGSLIARFKTQTDKGKSESDYLSIIDHFLTYRSLDKNDFEGAILSSVVPSLTRKIKTAVERLIFKECLVVSKNIRCGLKIQIDNPLELGADLICDAVGAVENYKEDTIILDCGTCTKIMLVTADRCFKGTSFWPGLEQQVASLVNSSAQLMEADLVLPERLLGKSTTQAISGGILYSTIYAAEGISKKLEEEYQHPLKKVLTGGDAYLIKDALKGFEYQPNLTLDGLYHIYLKNSGISGNNR